MKARTVGRIAHRLVIARGPRATYWATRAWLDLVIRTSRRASPAFVKHVIGDYVRFATNTLRPVEGQTAERARAATEWLLRAQAATPDEGVSFGYFPGAPDARAGWRPSYPETTGYIVPSLLDYAERFKDNAVAHHALRMAHWETTIQMPSGAVQGGPVCPPERQIAAVFNTGMVLHGYTAAYRVSRDQLFLDAGRRAANFLVGDLDERGHFRSHGTFVSSDRIKTYNCLCAWGLYRFGEDTGEALYRDAAVRAAEAATGEQRDNGWFANNCLTEPAAPLLHTIGYTLQGLLEVGILAGRRDLVQAAQRATDPLLARVSPHGFIHGRFYPGWQPAVFSSCLTGNAQLAVVCYRLYEHLGRERYREVAKRLVDHLKALQALNTPDAAINGAIAGSFPIPGGYMTGGYPNWATKYFLDALLWQHRVSGE